ALYQQVLHRAPDQAGFNAWVTALQSGQLTRLEVSERFLASPERRGIVVEQFYETLLDRRADPGSAFWVNSLLNGTLSEAGVVIGIVTSPEFTQKHPDNLSYVAAIYQRLLVRPNGTSQQELAFQTNALNTGLTTRGLMALSFLSSHEAYVKTIDGLYG